MDLNRILKKGASMKNSILILGATGNIGSFLVQKLQENKADFVAGVPDAELPVLGKQNVRGVELDFGDRASLEKAMEGVENLFMLLPLEETMLGWARNIVDIASKSMVKFIVRSSLMDAAPGSPYDLYNVHGRIDEMVRSSGIPYCIVHPNSFMQNFVTYYRDSILNNDAIYFSHGDAAVSFTDVRDIAAVDAAVLLNPAAHQNKEYTVTGPEALSGDQAADIISGAAERRVRYVRVPEQQYIYSMKNMGMSDWDISMSVSIEHHIRDGKSATVSEDVKKLLGREPNDFRHFAQDYASSWKKVPVHA
jgi:uncharacterized protein YbjT (DUF2867 family)